jgi:hypothetical protein
LIPLLCSSFYFSVFLCPFLSNPFQKSPSFIFFSFMSFSPGIYKGQGERATLPSPIVVQGERGYLTPVQSWGQGKVAGAAFMQPPQSCSQGITPLPLP